MQTTSIQLEVQSNLKQQQNLLINLAMKQAFHVMQLPLLELSEWLKCKIESNPVLEIDLSNEPLEEHLDTSFRIHRRPRSRSQENLENKRKEHQESMVTASVSLYEHMTNQAPLFFEKREDLHLAEWIIGHLNDKGYLETPLQEVSPQIPLEKMEALLQVIQTFDPPGIAARNHHECLLLQLKIKQKENSLAYQIIKEHFNDLIHNKLSHVAQKLHISIETLTNIIQKEISPLDLNPGYQYCRQPIIAIIPDLYFFQIEDKWHIEINTSLLPKFQIAPLYIKTLNDRTLENKEYSYLRRHISGGKWLKRIVRKRNQTLLSIGEFLLKRQFQFFNGDQGKLIPLTMKEAADEIGLHESTIARATANKYLACPLGMFSLKSFFKQGIKVSNGEKISNQSLRAILAKTVQEEDKSRPLSDQQLTGHFRKLGIPCARRTITKYRSSLKIAPACQRKKWNCSKVGGE